MKGREQFFFKSRDDAWRFVLVVYNSIERLVASFNILLLLILISRADCSAQPKTDFTTFTFGFVYDYTFLLDLNYIRPRKHDDALFKTKSKVKVCLTPLCTIQRTIVQYTFTFDFNISRGNMFFLTQKTYYICQKTSILSCHEFLPCCFFSILWAYQMKRKKSEP